MEGPSQTEPRAPETRPTLAGSRTLHGSAGSTRKANKDCRLTMSDSRWIEARRASSDAAFNRKSAIENRK